MALSFEMLICPKPAPPERAGEDILGVSGQVFWLLDESSTPNRLAVQSGQPQGEQFTREVDLTFRTLLTQKPDAHLVDLLRFAEK